MIVSSGGNSGFLAPLRDHNIRIRSSHMDKYILRLNRAWPTTAHRDSESGDVGAGGVNRVVAGHLLGRRGDNAMEFAHAEEFCAAGIAAIGVKSEQALRPEKISFVNALARNSLQIEVATPRAMGVPRIDGRDLPGIKTVFAGAATPRAQAEEREKHVFRAAAARPAAGLALTVRTKH